MRSHIDSQVFGANGLNRPQPSALEQEAIDRQVARREAERPPEPPPPPETVDAMLMRVNRALRSAEAVRLSVQATPDLDHVRYDVLAFEGNSSTGIFATSPAEALGKYVAVRMSERRRDAASLAKELTEVAVHLSELANQHQATNLEMHALESLRAELLGGIR